MNSDKSISQVAVKYLLNRKKLNESKKLFSMIAESIAEKQSEQKDLLEKVHQLRSDQGLTYALLALYRQQVDSGFVLGDPLDTSSHEIKHIHIPDLNIDFTLCWNPHRRLRGNAELLTTRGVVRKDVAPSLLVNEGCFLCTDNIEKRNPKEILFQITLAGEKYYLGANLAYITNNHFTVITSTHRDQKYDQDVLVASNDLLDATNGNFRAIYNGRAGASILAHHHLQATTEQFPIEKIALTDQRIVYKSKNITAWNPQFLLPLFVFQSTERQRLEEVTHNFVSAWINRGPDRNTVNIISVKQNNSYKMYVFLRDTRKMFGRGKKGFMASFEMGGVIVLSHDPAINETEDQPVENERFTFDNATPQILEKLFTDVAPEPVTLKQDGDDIILS